MSGSSGVVWCSALPLILSFLIKGCYSSLLDNNSEFYFSDSIDLWLWECNLWSISHWDNVLGQCDLTAILSLMLIESRLNHGVFGAAVYLYLEQLVQYRSFLGFGR